MALWIKGLALRLIRRCQYRVTDKGDPKSAVLSLQYGDLLTKKRSTTYNTPKGKRTKKKKSFYSFLLVDLYLPIIRLTYVCLGLALNLSDANI